VNLNRMLITCFVFSCVVVQSASAEVKPFKKGSFSGIKHDATGTDTVIVFWSENCSPCMREMPLWQKVSEENPEVDMVFISTDNIDQEAAIRQITDQFGLSEFDSWAFSDRFVERVYFDVDPRWHGELPLTYFYSAEGEEKKVLGLMNEDIMDTWLAKDN